MKSLLLFSAVPLVLLAGILMSAAPLQEKENINQRSFFDQLSTQPVARFTLTFDTDQLEEMKKQDTYTPATFSHDGNHWDAKIKVRGRYRRRICDFPPLKIKMSKNMLAAAGLQQHNKFKLVTHCSDDFDNRDNILREQLAYELYHLITGEGFRTQLVEVTYRNVRTGKSIERFGILIEDTDEMAQSMSATKCKDCINIPQVDFAENNLERVALFQYMIGNTDWNFAMARNMKIVQEQNSGKYRAVPYDFDFSGMVNAEYAVPNPDYVQTDVRERVWMWGFETSSKLPAAIGYFLSKEMEIMAHVNHNDLLSNKSRREVSHYLSSFFKDLKSGVFLVPQ